MDVRHCQEPVPLWEGAGPLAFLQEVCKRQSVRLGWPFSSYYFAGSLRPCRSLFLPTLIAVVVILLDLGTRMPWLASKKNYFLPYMLLLLLIGCRISSLPTQMLECGLGWFKWPPALAQRLTKPRMG